MIDTPESVQYLGETRSQRSKYLTYLINVEVFNNTLVETSRVIVVTRTVGRSRVLSIPESLITVGVP